MGNTSIFQRDTSLEQLAVAVATKNIQWQAAGDGLDTEMQKPKEDRSAAVIATQEGALATVRNEYLDSLSALRKAARRLNTDVLTDTSLYTPDQLTAHLNAYVLEVAAAHGIETPKNSTYFADSRGFAAAV